MIVSIRDVIRDLYGEGRFDSPNCNIGSKPCGDTCIPQRYNCRINKKSSKQTTRAAKIAGGVAGTSALIGGGVIAVRHHMKVQNALDRARSQQVKETSKLVNNIWEGDDTATPEEIKARERQGILEGQRSQKERRTTEYQKRAKEGVDAANEALKKLGLEQLPSDSPPISPPLPSKAKRKAGARVRKRKKKGK